MSRAELKHKHHIDPKHSGGDPNGPTIELTIKEHAEEHRILWLKEGRDYDRIAWLALSGLIGKEQIYLEILKSPERRKKISESRKGMKFTNEHKENLSKSHIGQKAWNKGLTKDDPRVALYTKNRKPMTDAHKKSISKVKKQAKWFNNGTISKFVPTQPEGFVAGRISWKV